ncbi:methylaspartate mutase [Saccharothrix longispora]|uniref:methylaspartate mutase n=1 Tax=Saccharothrix longispora TaxID=33920 RepID=UPI0028FDC462|nr:methylaspartate mutase [Saccharothrix longispora]MDU0293223.1 methylaspartate mutase [Saccharothrix longispora]
MFDGPLTLAADVRRDLPPWNEVVGHIRASRKLRAVDLLAAAVRSGRPVMQPRCGVGGHREMLDLLRTLEAGAEPGMLSVTIDSHTRLKHFASARRALVESPDGLNGYPLVAHGWRRGRELDAAVTAPLEVRHGSPDGRELFAVALASGITSFEGGGIGYNLPYSRDVPLAESLAAWREVDAVCGALADDGVLVERELFGTLTGVLVPPSISLASTLVEALLAVEQGVRCVSVAYPQGGEVHQDVAALRAIGVLAERYLPGVQVFPVLHTFMGVFPDDRSRADALILHGALTGRLGGAAKVITKTRAEAHGIPSAADNVDGILTSALACSPLIDFVRLDEERVAEELAWVVDEVVDLVEPLLDGGDLAARACAAFESGALDIPFSASVHARSAVVPMRDPSGAIRYRRTGALPFSTATLARHTAQLAPRLTPRQTPVDELLADIYHFAGGDPTAFRLAADRPGPAFAASAVRGSPPQGESDQ